jgi:hypothetical protein
MISRLKAIAKKHGYVLHTEPYRLNLWGVRSPTTLSGVFDDSMFLFFNKNVNGGRPDWQVFVFPFTTDPSTFWLGEPMTPKGTAILKAGQWSGYQIGLHRGKYYALVQRKPVTVFRDNNRDSILDRSGELFSGLFGINIHRANSKGITKTISRHSAGCQVFQNVEHFDLMMKLAEVHKRLYGNEFTYTLIDLKEIERQAIKFGVYAAATAGVLGVAGYFLYRWFNNPVPQQKTHTIPNSSNTI